MPRRSRARRVLRLIGLNALLTLALCLAVEGVVRLAHPQIRPAGTTSTLMADSVYGTTLGIRPGATGQSSGAAFASDARGVWRYANARPGLPLWLFLGDSVTMGIGVAPDSTFAGRIATQQDTLDIVNPSLVGYASDDYRAVFEAWLRRSQPGDSPLRRVTVFWCLNDAVAGRAMPDVVEGPMRVLPAVRSFVFRHIHTYQWLRATFFDRPLAYYRYDRRFYADDAFRPYLEDALGHLAAMHAQAQARGLPFEVVLLPYAAQLRDGDRLPQEVMLRELRARGIPARDLWRVFYPTDNPAALYLYGDGIHLSAEGHRRVAEALR